MGIGRGRGRGRSFDGEGLSVLWAKSSRSCNAFREVILFRPRSSDELLF